MPQYVTGPCNCCSKTPPPPGGQCNCSNYPNKINMTISAPSCPIVNGKSIDMNRCTNSAYGPIWQNYSCSGGVIPPSQACGLPLYSVGGYTVYLLTTVYCYPSNGHLYLVAGFEIETIFGTCPGTFPCACFCKNSVLLENAGLGPVWDCAIPINITYNTKIISTVLCVPGPCGGPNPLLGCFDPDVISCCPDPNNCPVVITVTS